MNICLISLYDDIYALGLRSISTYLKKQGHIVILLFLPYNKEKYGYRNFKAYNVPYSKNELHQIISFLQSRKFDLIGMSVIASYLKNAIQLTSEIKKHIATPIIWGGVHPTLCPQDCIKYADMVCVGEGEVALLDLINRLKNKKHILETKNIWFRKGDKIVRNDVRQLQNDLDVFGLPDYDFKTQFVLQNEKIGKMDMNGFIKENIDMVYGSDVYRIITSRGCYNNCTYCFNSSYKKIYANKGSWVRRRSVHSVIEELIWAKNKFPYIRIISIADDNMLNADTQWITDFSRMYKKKVGLPFWCLMSPLNADIDKLKLLKKAGLFFVVIGLESGSRRVNREIYNRNVPNIQVVKSVKIVQNLGIDVNLDIILDNPYENYEDKFETLKLLLILSKPYKVTYYSLVFFKGTEIYYKATKNGLISNEIDCIEGNYKKISLNYMNALIVLAPYMPKMIISYFARKTKKVYRTIFYLFVILPLKIFYKGKYHLFKYAINPLKGYTKNLASKFGFQIFNKPRYQINTSQLETSMQIFVDSPLFSFDNK